MPTLTIRNIDPQVHQRLRERAARNGRSVEAEVREILRDIADGPEKNFGLAWYGMTRTVGGVELDIPERSRPREADFS